MIRTSCTHGAKQQAQPRQGSQCWPMRKAPLPRRLAWILPRHPLVDCRAKRFAMYVVDGVVQVYAPEVGTGVCDLSVARHYWNKSSVIPLRRVCPDGTAHSLLEFQYPVGWRHVRQPNIRGPHDQILGHLPNAANVLWMACIHVPICVRLVRLPRPAKGHVQSRNRWPDSSIIQNAGRVILDTAPIASIKCIAPDEI